MTATQRLAGAASLAADKVPRSDYNGGMRTLIILAAAMCCGPAFGQGFDGSIRGGLSSGFGGGFSGNVEAGLRSTFEKLNGPVGLQTDQFLLEDRERLTRLDLERQGINAAGCAPGQIDINRSGCVPAREALSRRPSTYDNSVQALAPLHGLILEQTLSVGAGPQTSIDQ